jgi:ubiquinone/menaquinone biosynthesis C-methylase UbiE
MEGMERKFVNSRLKYVFQKRFEMKIYSKMIEGHNIDLQNKRVLDAGCGAGYGLELIEKRFRPKQLYGIDIDPEEVRIAKSRAGNSNGVTVQDLASTEFDDDFFDSVFVFTVLHHMAHWKKALGEIQRILKPDGSLFLNEHNKTSLDIMKRLLGVRHPDMGRFTWQELEAEIKDAHFDIVEKKTYLKIFGFYLCISS